MVGFNEQESAYEVFSPTNKNLTQESVEHGLSISYVRLALRELCKTTTPLSVNLCIEFYIKTYGLDVITNDTERGIRLSYVLGMLKRSLLFII